jgi:5-methylcytosine-specific restriction enzyme A
MAVSDVTRASVLAAVEEFDYSGRKSFLGSCESGPAASYFLRHDGKFYDSTAIIEYADYISTGMRVKQKDKIAAPRLDALGFEVVDLSRPKWTYDEIVLACALAESNGWRQVYDTDERAKELSRVLQSPLIHPFPHHPDFRNDAGVGQKTRNIVDNHPAHRGSRSNGNRLDKKVLNDFLADLIGMRAEAERIRDLLTTATPDSIELPDLDTLDIPIEEGGLTIRAHLCRERDPKLRRRKIDDTKSRGLPIACEVCDFDFGQVYGAHGRDYIECHHRTPLHVTGATQTMLADLALLCSNCHRMIHRTKKWLTVEELKDLLTRQGIGARRLR